MRETLHTNYEERYIKTLFNNNEPLNEKKYHKFLKKIHTNEVSDALLSYENSPILDERASKVAKDEQKRPRSTRRTLAHLRSGYSKSLHSYRHRIHRTDNSVFDFYQVCNNEPHTNKHLFNCSLNPTTLKPIGLGKQPEKTAPQPPNPTTSRRNPTANNNNEPPPK